MRLIVKQQQQQQQLQQQRLNPKEKMLSLTRMEAEFLPLKLHPALRAQVPLYIL